MSGTDRVTLKQISQKIGVGISTVSQILNNRPVRCTKQTREKVLAAAKEMAYKPNTLARGLRGARTHTVGMAWALVGSHSPVEMTQSIADRINSHGYITYVANNMADKEITRELLSDFAWRRADAVVVEMHWPIDEKLLARLRDFPAALAVGSVLSDVPVDQVIRDRAKAIKEVAEHFATTGRRRPAIVMPVDSSRGKIAAYAAGLTKHGLDLPPEMIVNLDWELWQKSSLECCHAGLDASFPTGRPPFDALMCVTDEVAIAAMAWARNKGLRIPEDVAVVGFNDNEFARCLEIPLASIRRRKHEVAATIERMLFARLADPSLPPQLEHLPMEFICRESAG